MLNPTLLPYYAHTQMALVLILLISFVVLVCRFYKYRKNTTSEIERLRAEVSKVEEAGEVATTSGGADVVAEPTAEAVVNLAEVGDEAHKERAKHSTDPDRDFLDQIGAIIELNIANAQFSVNDLAEAAHMSRSVLFERVKSLTGNTPNNYIKSVRLERAAQLLSKGKHKVSDICDLVGFNTPSYFAKCFCERYGMMPKEYAAHHTEQKSES